MKLIYIILGINLIGSLFLVKNNCAQPTNIIPNPGFELGTPRAFPVACDYSTAIDHGAVKSFNKDVDNWEVAKHHEHRGQGDPDWIKLSTSTCYGRYKGFCTVYIFPVIPPIEKIVYIESERKGNRVRAHTHEAIVSDLTETLQEGETYVFRIKYANFDNNVALDNDGIKHHLKVHFTELGGKKWNKVNINQSVFSKGIYYIRLISGIDIATKKLVIN